ncbi:MAG: glycosyltransferase [Candidatus Omnitrophota bacterium]
MDNRNSGDRIVVFHLVASWLDKIYGGEAMALALARKIDRNRFEPIIACFKDPRAESHPPLIDEARRYGIKTEVIELGHRFDIRAVFKLKELLKKHRVDILHCHAYKADTVGFLASKMAKVKLVSTCHGWWPDTAKLKLYDLIDATVLRYFDKVAAVSAKIYDDMVKRGIKGSKLEIILNGIDIERYSADGNTSEGKKAFGIGEGCHVVGSVGRLSREKGIKYLLEAAPDIIRKVPDVRFLIAGEGDEKGPLMEYADREGLKEKVIFAGYREDAEKIYPLLDVFVMPSLTEGIPLSLLEAMASARPIVASRVGGIPSVITDNRNGLLAEPQDSGALSAGIITLITDSNKAAAFGNRAREDVKEKFSIGVTAGKYQELYLKLLK